MNNFDQIESDELDDIICIINSVVAFVMVLKVPPSPRLDSRATVAMIPIVVAVDGATTCLWMAAVGNGLFSNFWFGLVVAWGEELTQLRKGEEH